MPQRETRDFITPGGHTVVLRTYLTGREATEIKRAMFDAVKLNMEDVSSGKVNLDSVPAAFIVEQEKRALEFLVVSVDGRTDAPADILLDLPQSEYEAVVAEINQIQNPTKPEKSAQPGGATSQSAQ